MTCSGEQAAALKLGDGVSMAAEKTTYNGVPELTNITEVFVDSEGNPVNHPDAVDITAQAGTYEAAEAEYVKLTGTLSVSGNYYNIALDAFPEGDKQGSIVYPVEGLEAKSFDGKKITVTGYFNGLSSKGKYINIIATKIVEAVDNPKGTVDNPYLASATSRARFPPFSIRSAPVTAPALSGFLTTAPLSFPPTRRKQTILPMTSNATASIGSIISLGLRVMPRSRWATKSSSAVRPLSTMAWQRLPTRRPGSTA